MESNTIFLFSIGMDSYEFILCRHKSEWILVITEKKKKMCFFFGSGALVRALRGLFLSY